MILTSVELNVNKRKEHCQVVHDPGIEHWIVAYSDHINYSNSVSVEFYKLKKLQSLVI